MSRLFDISELCAAIGSSVSIQRAPGMRMNFSFPASLDCATPEQFSFCHGEGPLPRIRASRAGLVICHKSLEGKKSLPSDKVLFFVDKPRLAFVRVLRKFFSDVLPNVVLGQNFRTQDGVVLGTEGFGFVEEKDGALVRFPCVGGIRIGDDVEIDAGSIIDRGNLGDTVIGNNTKIGKLVMVGHNSRIGNNCIIGACTSLSGNTVVGDNVWIAPRVATNGHLKIGDRAFVGTGSVVTKNIRPGWVAYGNPAKEIRHRTTEGILQ